MEARLLTPYSPAAAASPPLSPSSPLIDLSSSPEKSPTALAFGFHTPRSSLSTPQAVDLSAGFRRGSNPATGDPSLYYRAAYPFTAHFPNQLTLVPGELLIVQSRTDLTGNAEWWCVQNSAGLSGYVPANHLTPCYQ